MQIKTFTVGPFQMNSYIVSNGKHPDCILIDPGDDIDLILEYIEKRSLNPLAILATHGHLDHIRYLSEIQKRLQIPFYMGAEDLPLLESLAGQGRMFNLPVAKAPKVDIFLKETQSLRIGDNEINLLHTPGHSPGSFSFLVEGHIFVGDVLFKDSIGRTDLYGGNYDILIRTIMDKIFSLPNETIVYPGHGPSTTVGREKEYNPFLQS